MVKSRIKAATKQVFKEFGSLLITITVQKTSNLNYNLITKKREGTPSSFTARALLTNYTSEEIQSGMGSPEDVRATFEKSKLGFEIELEDTIIAQNAIWNIKTKSVDPSDSILTLRLHRG